VTSEATGSHQMTAALIFASPLALIIVASFLADLLIQG
jgi:hypothetical protein